ncbi:hypothetical protein F5Y16DRAFT_360306 [Xylariaceae sp. FL0255]|nr:hypothetical protein F5Y16DRAFT_360306 [Xylariaceae sp. FL0255]
MSSTIAIPATRSSAYAESSKASPGSPSSTSSVSSSPQTRVPAKSESPQPAHKPKTIHLRRPSLLSSALSKAECTHINIGDPDGPPRLISYLSSSQGFAWNPEMFLPSYLDYDYEPFENNRREPVHEIRLSDEEIKQMLP